MQVAGGLNLATAPLRASPLTALIDHGQQRLDVPLRHVTFCDCAAVSVLLDAREALDERRGSLPGHDPCWSLQTVRDILQLAQTLQPITSSGQTRFAPPATGAPTLATPRVQE